MPRKPSRNFTDVELEFMSILWDNDELTPEEIRKILDDAGRTIAIGSIRNVLAIMMKKGYVTRRKVGKAFLYKSKVDKENAQKSMLGDLLNSLFDSSESLMVAALLDRKSISNEEQQEIRRLIDEHGERE